MNPLSQYVISEINGRLQQGGGVAELGDDGFGFWDYIFLKHGEIRPLILGCE